jgi:hypothetical protein
MMQKMLGGGAVGLSHSFCRLQIHASGSFHNNLRLLHAALAWIQSFLISAGASFVFKETTRCLL